MTVDHRIKDLRGHFTIQRDELKLVTSEEVATEGGTTYTPSDYAHWLYRNGAAFDVDTKRVDSVDGVDETSTSTSPSETNGASKKSAFAGIMFALGLKACAL